MKNKLTWLEAALLIAPFVALAALWNQLPSRVPMHWNLRGEIDGWSSKPFGMLGMPIISVAVIALLHFLPRLDPKLRSNAGNEGRMKSALAILRVALAAFFAAIFCVQIAAALGHPVPAGRIVPTSILLLLAVIGNYLSNLRPNYFAGIRTPWTLESPATWRATHRLGSYFMFYGSLLLLAAQFFVSPATFVFLFVSAALLLIGWSFWYSWHHFNTHRAESVEGSARP
jgi:uncharacterized membrane protein